MDKKPFQKRLADRSQGNHSTRCLKEAMQGLLKKLLNPYLLNGIKAARWTHPRQAQRRHPPTPKNKYSVLV